MKQMQFVCLGILLVINTFAQTVNTTFGISTNEKEIINLNRISKEEVYNYTFNEKRIKDSALVRIFIYDSLGDLIEERFPKTKSYKESIAKYSYSYNSMGKLIKKIVDNQGLDQITIYEYDYDSIGNEINKYDYNKDTTRLTIEQKIYNKDNQVIQLRTKINNYDFYISRQYFYNEDNKLSKEDALDNKGIIMYSTLYDYDNSINKKTVYLENSNGKNLEAECFYNAFSQCIKIKSNYMNSTDNERKLNQVRENKYNTNKTLFETNMFVNERKVQMTRHYYFKY